MWEFKFLLECAQLPSKKTVSIYTSIQQWMRILISPHLTNTGYYQSSIFANLMSKKKAIIIFYRFVFLWLLVHLSMLSYIYWSFVFLQWIACLYYLPISLLDCCLLLIDLKVYIITLWYQFFLGYICYKYFFKVYCLSLFTSSYIIQKVFLCSKICQSFLVWPLMVVFLLEWYSYSQKILYM